MKRNLTKARMILPFLGSETGNEEQERLRLPNTARKPQEFRQIPQPQTRTEIAILGVFV
uniref:Uncharacterized protein n=1 Tax=Solanum tuberosum TaxID=4113 RepID=M1D498_SOLTU